MEKTLSDGDFTRIWALAMTLTPGPELDRHPERVDAMIRDAVGLAVELYVEFRTDLAETPIVSESAGGTRIEFWMTPEGQLTLTLPS